MPIAKNVPGPACNYREDRDPVAEDTGSESDDDRTLADILKRKESSSELAIQWATARVLDKAHPKAT